MSHHVVSGLRWAKESHRPVGLSKSKSRGAKAAGLRYEKALAKALPIAKHGQWFEFEDLTRRGYCQPDLLVSLGPVVLVLEAKYTWTMVGHSQLNQLYLPVVERALRRRAVGVVVCRALTPETPKESIFSTLLGAVTFAATGRPAVLHWFSGSLGPQIQALQSLPLALASQGA